MTPEEIIEMAKQAGFDEHHAKFDTRIETFAKLVAEKEKKEWVGLTDDEKQAAYIILDGGSNFIHFIESTLREKNK